MASFSEGPRGRDSAAVQFMVLDILETLVDLSENPGRMGTYLAQQVRELVGARMVAILHPLGEGQGHRHGLIALEPARHGTPENLVLLEELAQLAHQSQGAILWQGEGIPDAAQALLAGAGFNGALVLPLMVGTRSVGLLVIVHLLDMQRNSETMRALELLGPVAALVIQNARFFESQETVIQARTQDLREREERHRTILQTAMDGFWLLDTQGRLLEVNKTYCRMSGYSAQELLAMHVFDLEASESTADIAARMQKVMTCGEDRFETRHRRKDGSTFEVEVSVQFRPFEGGRLVAFLQDITHRKEAEEERVRLQAQLLQSQKLESLGTLAGGVAHDMNNVLGAILGLASANLERQPPESPTYQAFDTITRAATRGGKMVKTLLGFARQDPAEAKDLDQNALLREELRLQESTLLAGVRVELDLAPELRLMRGDAAALTNAVMNLCVNAVDAMPGSGTLTLRTRNVDSDWLEIRVEDTGCGMSKEVLGKALDPFFTTKAQGKGTGLGLAMVYGTVKAHQGQLELQSEPGHGTRVTLRFPACEPDTVFMLPLAVTPVPTAIGGQAILLIDDDELVQHATAALLEVLGHQVTIVSSGEEALTYLETGLPPDLVILDMNMPGLGGGGTLPLLRALRPTVPVLLATGRADQTALDLVEAHPLVTLLSKPFSMEELQQRLETI